MLQALLMQASFDGDSIVRVTFGGLERYQIYARTTSRLADMYDQLTREHLAGRLGPGLARVAVVLPEGWLLSSVSAEEMFASVFGASLPGSHSFKEAKSSSVVLVAQEAFHGTD
ncbi:unnamed protein product [Prorocentrum cordatum]|uniref:Uncharacterized protein n=1 Tax=Prorocentrum cordatum TaxID=2364126 RepID=A0ABN9TBA7_9DINO|nr:unnamed protein product [Polarella glacialis]